MLMNYLRIGISTFIILIPIAIIIFAIYYGIKFLNCILAKKKLIVHISVATCEFFWILTIISILKITGIIGGDFGTTSLFSGTAVLDFNLFAEGFSMATILNILLFVPFGFFIPIIFKQQKAKWLYEIMFGLVFSFIIELLQTFTGRFVQIDDIIMNTLGACMGYNISLSFIKRKR